MKPDKGPEVPSWVFPRSAPGLPAEVLIGSMMFLRGTTFWTLIEAQDYLELYLENLISQHVNQDQLKFTVGHC